MAGLAGRRAHASTSDGTVCPRCGSLHVHRSRTRNRFEQLRRFFGRSVPYRCSNCHWRGWLIPVERHDTVDTGPLPYADDSPEPALEEVDRALERPRRT